jgi:hypothetical protein
MYQHFAFQGPPKYSQIGIFGMKINHLATLMGGGVGTFVRSGKVDKRIFSEHFFPRKMKMAIVQSR